MNRLTLLPLLTLCALATTGTTQENAFAADDKAPASKVRTRSEDSKSQEIKFDMDHIDKQFFIQLKSAKLDPTANKDEMRLTLILEFTQDSGGTFDRMRDAFAGKCFLGREAKQSVLLCYFFDDDGVVFAKQSPGRTEGELSSYKGDRFRIIQFVATDILARTKTISFRSEFVNRFDGR